jgi:hypothetical protein
MKFTLPITLLAVAVSVDAAAVGDQDKRYCSADGQACDTVRRAAEAFRGTIELNTNLVTRDETPSELSYIARRQLHELALAIAASHDDPAAFYASLGFTPAPTGTDVDGPSKREADPAWCTQFIGMPCWKREGTPTDIEQPTKREADPGWCTQFIGMPCWKRDATPTEQEQPSKREAHPGWCTQFIGMPCWKRDNDKPDLEAREPLADGCTQALGQPCWARDTTPAVHAKRDAEAEADPGWCRQFIGMPCWKRDAEPGWCRQFIGMPCWKRSEGSESEISKRDAEAEPDRYCTRFTGSSCWKRDGSAVAADEVKRCTSEGQACWKVKRAAAAVINAIDQGNAIKMARDADPGWCRQFIGMPCWKRAATCNSPAGICTKATRDLHAMYNAARTIIES